MGLVLEEVLEDLADGVVGQAVAHFDDRGTLNAANAAATQARTSAGSMVAPAAGTTKALTSWPNTWWSTPTTHASATAGCSTSRFSISIG